MSINLSTPQISNCILWNNTVDASEDEVYIYMAPSTTFTHCDIYGCGGSDNWQSGFGTDGGGNIDADPDFADPENLDGLDDTWATKDDGLMPGPDSPCINRAYYWHGESDSVWLDVRGKVRNEVSSYPDIGAYESKYKIMLVMCFIDETHGQSYYDDENEYNTDLAGFADLLASLPYANDANNFSILKAGCIVPPYVATDYEGNIADVLPAGFFDPDDPPEILLPEDEPVGISIAECNRSSTEPTGDELIAHFHRIREGVVPDCIVRLADNTDPLYGFGGDLYNPYFDEFKPWLKDWLRWHGLHPVIWNSGYPSDNPDVLPAEVEFGYPWEQWIYAITDNVDGIINP